MSDDPRALLRGVELGGVTEIAREFGVGNNNVAMWMARREVNGFPTPLVSLARGDVFIMDEVRRWHETRPPARNRPKSEVSQ